MKLRLTANDLELENDFNDTLLDATRHDRLVNNRVKMFLDDNCYNCAENVVTRIEWSYCGDRKFLQYVDVITQ